MKSNKQNLKYIEKNKPEDLVVYTTGAFLIPMKIQIAGKKFWVWKVLEITDDSYCGGKCCFPVECVENSEDLLAFDES
jgi:hypothetical protein